MIAVQKPQVEWIDFDQRVTLHNVPWSTYEALLDSRGESAMPRISYLEGTLELMTVGKGHEGTKKMLARLIEAYAFTLGIPIDGFGSWTLRSEAAKSGAEPDECYIRGSAAERETPDLAIEVIFTSGGLDKLKIYRGLGVREVWCWQEVLIRIFELRKGGYQEIERSAVLPELDIALIAELVTKHERQHDALVELQNELRKRR